MRLVLLMIMVCLWALQNQVQVNCQEQSRNLGEKTSNEKWIAWQRQNQNPFFSNHLKRNNGGQMKTNISVGKDVPYAVGLEEALYYRNHYFRENDKEAKLTPERNFNKLHLRAHRIKIMNGHRVVPHHLRLYNPKFDRSARYTGNRYWDSAGNDSVGAHTATTSGGIRGRFQNLIGDPIMHLFVKNETRENAMGEELSKNYPKHRKRSEFELISIMEPPRRKPSPAHGVIQYRSEESDFLNRFIMPRIAHLSLQEKSSGKFDKNLRIICEKNENTQNIICRNSEINVIRKEEDAMLHSDPNSKTKKLSEPSPERDIHEKSKHLAPFYYDYYDQNLN